MNVTFDDLKPNFILDYDSESEIIDFHWGISEETKFYYFKHKYLPTIEEENVRIQSIWCADLVTRETKEVFPFSLLNIDYTENSLDHFYFAGTMVKENDGFFKYDNQGKIFRINKKTLKYEQCLKINSDYFHGFETVTDNFLVFRYEDHTPDNVTEIIIVDLKNKIKASIFDFWGTETEYNYELIQNKNGEIQYLLIKRWIKESSSSSETNDLKCFLWNDFIKQLNWSDIGEL